MFTSTPIYYYVGQAENILFSLFVFSFFTGLWAMMLWKGLRKGEFLAISWMALQMIGWAYVSFGLLS